MSLLFLLLVPLILGLVAMLTGKGKITVKEFLLQEAIIAVVIGVGYALALSNRSSDVEHWNGKIAKKWRDTGSCCHSYQCNCRETCTGSGNNRSCSTTCDTCYEHSHDKEWYASTTNGETAYSNTCGRPSSSDPTRWEAIVVGEPTSIEHSFTNYIKANPDSVLRRQGLAEKWKAELPKYPEVYDLYRADKVIVTPNVPRSGMNLRGWNTRLAELNGDLGAAKQVDTIIVITAAADRSYLQALQEHWLGGKKNDVVVIIGAPHFPDIAWADVMSWSRSEEMKIEIRDAIQAMGQFDFDKLIPILKSEISAKFVRRKFADFAYLKSTVEPTETMMWVLGVLGLALSVGLWIFFHHKDVFGEERSPFASRSPVGSQWPTPPRRGSGAGRLRL
jgi:hypothetical protein